MDYSDDLVATLPRDEAELMARSENLSADARGRFAARLALAHKDNLATEVLVRRLLHTQPLSDEIQVQTDPLVSTGSADDWDVVAKVATKKMTIVQTNACKKLHQRVVGIQMAVALRNEQLLNEIIAHPSQTMKEKAKSTLAEIRAEMNPRTVVEPDHTANFILYFDAIRDAPMQVITGDSARTRNQVWEEFANAKWNLFWTNGSLKSITDRVLRTKAAEILLQLLKTVPPFNSIQVKTEFVHVPYLPVLIRKNLKLLLKMDVTETVTAVCSVLSDRTVNIESDLLSPLLSRKHNVWSDLSKSSKLASMVDKVLVATRGAKPKDDRNTASTLFNKRILDVFLGARPVRSILLHLLQDAQQSNTLLLTVYTAAIASEKNDLARFKLTENFLKDLRTALEYIFAILSNLLKRILATGTMETKHESQLIFEADVKGTLDVVLNIFEDAFAVLPTTEGVQLKFTNKKKSHKWSMLLSPLFTILQEHPQLAMYLFLAVKDEFSETDTSGASLVLNCLKSKSLSVFDYPGNTTEAPYSGINRFGPHNHEAFVLFMKLYPVLDKWQFWSNAVATECLSVDQIGLLKNHFTIEFLGQQSCYVITTILDQLIVDAVERGAMALQLIAFVKKRELPAIQIKYIIDQLYERLDVCVVESRTLLEENLRQPSIDSRVDAIRQFLKATNMSHSIGETILTLSCIFQRVK
ncbi:hypothetical protein BC830DRAFT_1168317 [Chytriomyces sp. MP71]|nr:hypothetical protein BC830DRAFT_1168317 [Chytriomyces sp. MP71]